MEEEKQGPNCGHSRCSQEYIDTGRNFCRVNSELRQLDQYLQGDGLCLAHQLERLGKGLDLTVIQSLGEQIREAARLVEMEAIARDHKTSVAFCTNCGSPGVELDAWVLCNSGQVLDYTGSDRGCCHTCGEVCDDARVDFEEVPRADRQKRIEERWAMADAWMKENHPSES
jgi:hypothetical protein